MSRLAPFALSVLVLCQPACDPSAFRAAKAAHGADAGMPKAPVDAGNDGTAHAGASGAAHAGRAGSANAGRSGTGGAGASGRSALAGSGGAAQAGYAGSSPPVCPQAADAAAVQVTALELGTLSKPASIVWRAGGFAERVRDRVVWVFSAADNGLSMATWSNTQDLQRMPLQLDDTKPFAPLFSSFDDAAKNLRPTGAWLSGTQEVHFFFTSFAGFIPSGVGIARLAVDASNATILAAVGEVFANDPAADGGSAPLSPSSLVGAFSEGGFVYAYACAARAGVPDEQAGGKYEQPCRVTRVVNGQLLQGDKYTYWDGTAWVADFEQAVPVMDHVVNGLTVGFNSYLGKYLATSSGKDNNVVLRWADKPSGPFHDLADIPTLKATGGFGFTYAAAEHATLRESCERVLFVSYMLPLKTNSDSDAQQETHLVRVTLE